MHLFAVLVCHVLFAAAVVANTEKTIFKAPAASKLPTTRPSKEYLNVPLLTDVNRSVQTSLSVGFPNTTSPEGHSHWYLLRALKPLKRYELRICWPATQPTSFRLNTYKISDVFDSPLLLQDLAKTLQSPDTASDYSGKSGGTLTSTNTFESVLYLHIQAAADFYSLNTTLMLTPPEVDVDIILDPYILGIFPESLRATALYIIALAIGGSIVSNAIWALLSPTPQKLHIH